MGLIKSSQKKDQSRETEKHKKNQTAEGEKSVPFINSSVNIQLGFTRGFLQGQNMLTQL